MTDLTSTLNQRQREAVTAPTESLLVLAGAGSGKTRVLTTRIAWLIQQGLAQPYEILAVTFTNKAAKEMMTRLESILPMDIRHMWVGTFHGLCNRILRAHAEEAGLPKTFQIMDSGDQLSMIKRVMKDLNIDPERIDARQVQTFINWNKEHALRASRSRDDVGGTGVRIYTEYERRCQMDGVLDFGELMLRCYELLDRNEVVRTHYQNRFRFMLVDEFQDTNILQYRWIQMLAGWGNPERAPNAVFAVGDDDQSIYAFRGARVENMKQFLKDFKITNPVRLEENYRSTSKILEAANALISHNPDRMGKNLWTNGASGEPIDIVTHEDDRAEANWIVDKVVGKAGRYSDHAVLYRTNAQSRALESAFQARGIPYRIYGGLRFFERAEVKHVMAYMRLLANPDEDTSFLRVVNFPTRGIGAKSVDTLQTEARRLGLSLWGTIASANAQYPARLAVFTDMMDAMREEARGLSLCELVKLVIRRSGLEAHYRAERQGDDKLENMNEIIAAAEGFCQNEGISLSHDAFEPYDETGQTPLLGFLAQSTLEAGDKNEGNDVDAVQLMTVHAAKGLEFPYVYLAGVEDGVFPHFSAKKDPKGEFEERRLMYVAITRAQKYLAICHCESRMMYGETRFNQPSDFLEEIPESVVARIGGRPKKPAYRGDSTYGWERPSFGGSRGGNSNYGGNNSYGGSNSYGEGRRSKDDWTGSGLSKKDRQFTASVAARKAEGAYGFAPGQRVHHPKFEYGTVVALKGSGSDARIVVDFVKVGQKELLLELVKTRLGKVDD